MGKTLDATRHHMGIGLVECNHTGTMTSIVELSLPQLLHTVKMRLQNSLADGRCAKFAISIARLKIF